MSVVNVQQAGNAAKAQADAVAKGGAAGLAAFQNLAKAYQTLAGKNAERLTHSIQALASAKTPVEFIELQQKLLREGVDAAVAESSDIAKLTAAVFTSAFEPIQKQVEALQSTAKN